MSQYIAWTYLELESQAHLHRPHAARSADPPELRAVDRAVRTSQIDMVQRIEHIGPERERLLLRDLEVLRQRKLDVPGAGGTNQALACRPRPDSHALVNRDQVERSGVDVLDVTAPPGAASASLDRLLQDSVPSKIVGAAMVRVRAALSNKDRTAAARREDPQTCQPPSACRSGAKPQFFSSGKR